MHHGHDGTAGEWGHQTIDPDGPDCGCGNNGCLETVATDAALARLVSNRLGRSIEIEEMRFRAATKMISEMVANMTIFSRRGTSMTLPRPMRAEKGSVH